MTQLSLQQEQLINGYIAKWRKYVVGNKHLDQPTLSHVIINVYERLNRPKPEITFFSSLQGAMRFLLTCPPEHLGDGLELDLEAGIARKLKKELDCQVSDASLRSHVFPKITDVLDDQLAMPLDTKIWDCAFKGFTQVEQNRLNDLIWIEEQKSPRNEFEPVVEYIFNGFPSMGWASDCCIFDFCATELKYKLPQAEWWILKTLLISCDYIFPYSNVCILVTISDAEKQVAGWESYT